MTRVTGIVAAVTNTPVKEVFNEMPLALVFSYEHYYYRKEGFQCVPKSLKKTLEALVS